jgi:hypothetical protein
MNGHNKYIAATAAFLSAVTVGVNSPPVAARPAQAPAISVAARSTTSASATVDRDSFEDIRASRPHRIDDDVSRLVVRLVGNTCTGTPITGTVYVVTAAHCVLTESGEVTQRTIVRDHVRYPAVAVLVNTEYHEHPSAANDAAVLIMAQEIPGPSARIGVSLPTSGELTLAGFQPLDSDGSLLRGKNVNDHPRPKNASGATDVLTYEPASCVVSADALEVHDTRVMVPCGLIPGASGGGLYVHDEDGYSLVGILSSVTADYKVNGVVPLDSLVELLAHPQLYAHGFSSHATDPNRHDRIERS